LGFAAQRVRHWLEKSEADGVVGRREHPSGKRTVVMMNKG